MTQKETGLEQAARAYADSEWNGSYESADSFEEGAKWMLDRMCKWYMERLEGIAFPSKKKKIQELRELMVK